MSGRTHSSAVFGSLAKPLRSATERVNSHLHNVRKMNARRKKMRRLRSRRRKKKRRNKEKRKKRSRRKRRRNKSKRRKRRRRKRKKPQNKLSAKRLNGSAPTRELKTWPKKMRHEQRRGVLRRHTATMQPMKQHAAPRVQVHLHKQTT
jgi:colicin import membrane protein